MDSGIGLLAAAAAVRRLRPDADLVLSLDPDGMPWGPRTPQDVTERALAVAEAAAAHRPDALIVACNTATVHALPALRARLEPGCPGRSARSPRSSPPRPAAVPSPIWATPATTGSPYQRGLIADFAGGVAVTEVPCPGLADAVEHADETAIDAAIAAAAALHPRRRTTTVVLGCTHYELVADRIRAAVRVPGARRCPARLRRRRGRAGAAQDRRPRPSPGRGARHRDRAPQRPRGRAARGRPGLRRRPPARRPSAPPG